MNGKLKVYFLLLAGLCPAHFAAAQSTAFTYHGRLNDNGVPANGAYDLRFTAYDAEVDGNVVAGPLPPITAEVVNGLFTVRPDFGADVFTGPARWLQIEVRPTGSVDFTPLSPRQEVTSSPYAIRAQTAGAVANGAVSADQLNTSGAAPAAGQILAYDGAGLLWTDPGVAAGNVWSLNGADAYYNAGNVGIGTNTPTPGIRLEVNGTTRFAPGGSGGVIQFGTPAGETGMAIFGNNRADIRFDNSALKLVVGTGNGAPSPVNGLLIDPNGHVGIGTSFPSERLKVGGAALADTKIEINAGGDSYAAMRLLNSAGSWLWQVTSSNDLPGGRMRLTDEWSGAERISITRAGNVGIGTTTPVAKLQAETAEPAKVAVHGVVSSTSSVGVYGSAATASSVGVWGRNPAGLAVYADGNAGQARDKGGFVKAMAYIDPFRPADQYVVRCYNSQLAGNASSTAPCGITVTRVQAGFYIVNFGFVVSDRIVSLSVKYRDNDIYGYRNMGVNDRIGTGAAAQTVEVFTFYTDDVEDTTDAKFTIIVF